jgi:type II secretory pathway component PulK
MIALLRETGVEQAVAETVAAAIEARVRPPAASGTPATLGTPVTSGTPAAKRPDVRFDSIDELADLPGMTAIAALRPHVSIYASAAVPILGSDPVVARGGAGARRHRHPSEGQSTSAHGGHDRIDHI